MKLNSCISFYWWILNLGHIGKTRLIGRMWNVIPRMTRNFRATGTQFWETGIQFWEAGCDPWISCHFLVEIPHSANMASLTITTFKKSKICFDCPFKIILGRSIFSVTNHNVERSRIIPAFNILHVFAYQRCIHSAISWTCPITCWISRSSSSQHTNLHIMHITYMNAMLRDHSFDCLWVFF